MAQYQIFDVNRPLLEKSPIFDANTPIAAARKYLKTVESYKNHDIKRDASNYVQISAREVVFRDGVMYLRSKPTQWYTLFEKD